MGVIKQIRSRDNPQFKELYRLATSSRLRRKQGLTLLDGVHLLQAYLESGGRPLKLMVSPAAQGDEELNALLHDLPDVPLLELEAGLFGALSELKTPTGLLALIALPTRHVRPSQPEFSVWLEDIQDPGNLGSILRTAAAAGCESVFLSPGCADVWSPKVLRAAMGGHFALDIHEAVDLPALAHAFDGRSYATTPKACQSLYDCDLRGRIAFAFGNEGAGLSTALQAAVCQELRIPMSRGVESLNVAAAAAICLFEAVRQRGAALCG